MTSTLDYDPKDNDNNSVAYLRYLEYREMDQENGGNRTILINGVPDWAIRLKPNRYYMQKAVENLVCGCCDRNNLDYGSLGTVTKCVEEIISKVNGHDDYVANTNETEIQKLPILSVSDVLRKHSGRHRTLAMIVGVSQPYKVITSIDWTCSDCGYQKFEEFDPPLSSSNLPHKKCAICNSSPSPTSDDGNGNDGKQRQRQQKQSDLIDLIALEQPENAKSISVQDSESNEDLEKLQVILLGDKMTRSVRAGEMAVITGTIHVLGSGGNNNNGSGSNSSKNSGGHGGKLFPILYAESIQYQRERDKPITEKDIEEFKEFAQKPDVINELVAKFAPNVIGHSDAKLGILRSAVSAKSDSARRRKMDDDSNGSSSNKIPGYRNRTHILLVGDPGTAKSMLAQEAKNIMPNSRYVTAQHASVKSLMGIVDKEQDNKMLMLGAVPMSKNAICVINEAGSMPYEDQQHLADTLEEGRFTIDKHGIYQEIDSPTTIILTTNPHGDRWNRSVGPSLDQVPIKSNILDRIDQFYIFEEFQTQEDRREYAVKKMEANQNAIVYDYEFLKKYLQYAATSIKEPVLTSEAATMLTDFWMRLGEIGSGSNRMLESLVRMARAQARLHLREEIDSEIADEIIKDVGLMYNKLGNRIDTSVADPRDLAYNEIIQYVNTLETEITFEEAAKHVSANSNAIKQYLGGRIWSIRENKKLRSVHDRFTDSGIERPKVGRGGLSITITKLSPLSFVKAGKQQRQSAPPPLQQQEQQQGESAVTTEKIEGSNRSLRSLESLSNTIREKSDSRMSESDLIDLSDSSDLAQTLDTIIHGLMRDSQGNNKDYFTTDDFIYATQMLPNEHWTEDEAEQTLHALLQEGKIEEIGGEKGPGSGKFKPTERSSM